MRATTHMTVAPTIGRPHEQSEPHMGPPNGLGAGRCVCLCCGFRMPEGSVNARRTEPTRSLLQGGRYVSSVHTDIRATFARAREQAVDFADVYRFLVQHYPRPYALARAAEIVKQSI